MRGCIIGEFVTTQPIPKTSFRSNAAFGEKLERAVNGRVADAFVSGANFAQQIFDGRVRGDFEERVDDQASLRCGTQALFEHVALKPRFQAIDGDLVFHCGDVPLARALVEHLKFWAFLCALGPKPQMRHLTLPYVSYPDGVCQSQGAL